MSSDEGGGAQRRRRRTRESQDVRRKKDRERKRLRRARRAAIELARHGAPDSSDTAEGEGEVHGDSPACFTSTSDEEENLTRLSKSMHKAALYLHRTEKEAFLQGKHALTTAEMHESKSDTTLSDNGNDDAHSEVGGFPDAFPAHANQQPQRQDGWEADEEEHDGEEEDEEEEGSFPWEDQDDDEDGAGQGDGDDDEGEQVEGPHVWRTFLQDLPPKERVALDIAAVKSTTNVSDTAITKLLKVFLKHQKTINELMARGQFSPDYTRCLRPLAIKHIPRVNCAVTLERTVGVHKTIEREEDLQAIPRKYLHLRAGGALRLLRVEAYVKLRDIKNHHAKTHSAEGRTAEELLEDYNNCAISLDGVQEARSGKRTFHVVSIRMGKCIYLHKVFNPIIGDEASKLTPEDLLRHVFHVIFPRKSA